MPLLLQLNWLPSEPSRSTILMRKFAVLLPSNLIEFACAEIGGLESYSIVYELCGLESRPLCDRNGHFLY